MPWFEFGWIPEFTKLNPHTRISQSEEEQLSFENLILVCKNYKRHGYENVVLTDLSDARLLDIPTVFEDCSYAIITLYAENDEVLKERILNRNGGNDYRNYEESMAINRLIKSRKTLPNEFRICSDKQTPIEIGDKIIDMAEHHKPMNSFVLSEYNKDDFFSYIKGYSEQEQPDG